MSLRLIFYIAAITLGLGLLLRRLIKAQFRSRTFADGLRRPETARPPPESADAGPTPPCHDPRRRARSGRRTHNHAPRRRAIAAIPARRAPRRAPRPPRPTRAPAAPLARARPAPPRRRVRPGHRSRADGSSRGRRR